MVSLVESCVGQGKALANTLLTVQEVAARQVYWRIPQWLRQLSRTPPGATSTRLTLERSVLIDHLGTIGIKQGTPLLLHSAVGQLNLTSGPEQPRLEHPLAVAEALLGDIRGLLGASGTLVMPGQGLFRNDPGYMFNNKDSLVLDYDPGRTPCGMGLINELFRRTPGTLRSLHPLNTLCALGPLADGLLEGNLDSTRPLPHGAVSGYYRFSQKRGMVLSLGVPLYTRFTIMHVAEDLRDQDWPVKSFWRERKFRIRLRGEWSNWVVRERRPEFARCIAQERYRRDLLREGILHESHINGFRVDWADSGEVVKYLMFRNEHGTYPYYLPSLAKPYS
jgi:aminoglycoside 3-N-acetyltransferase